MASFAVCAGVPGRGRFRYAPSALLNHREGARAAQPPGGTGATQPPMGVQLSDEVAAGLDSDGLGSDVFDSAGLESADFVEAGLESVL